MKKIFIFLILGVFLMSATFLIFYSSEKGDCENFGVVYLKSSELSLASEIADNLDVIVVLPEENQIIGNTEILNCEVFNYKNHIVGI